jgi:hypothetical protein
MVPYIGEKSMCALLLALSAVSLIEAVAHAQTGIAQKYYRDIGIVNDPDVIFAEQFETGTINDISNRWTNHQNTAGMSLVSDVPSNSGGTRSLQMTSIGGTNTGGYFYKKLPTEYDQMYFRYYIKYSSQGTYHHTGGNIGGYNPATDWPQGGSGSKPTGNDRFSIAAEPVDASLGLDLYTYWMGMKPAPDGNYWGNTFLRNSRPTLPLDRWICVEVMVKMNDPVTANNGELALWIDGQQKIYLKQGSPKGQWLLNMFTPDSNSSSTFEGFQWRNSTQLNINWIWLLYYTTDNPNGLVGKVWFDDIVVAKSYIGPLNALSTTGVPNPPSNLRVQ